MPNKKFIRSLILAGLFGTSWCASHAQFEQVEAYYEQLEKQESPTTIQFVQEEMELLEDYSGLRQIILLRHGEPALDKKGWRKRKEAIGYVIAYDTVGVYPPEYAPLQLGKEEVDVIYTSTLTRSISTAEQLFHRPDSQEAKLLFREFERKIFVFPNIKLPLKWWLTGSRIFWLMGLNKKGIERFADAKSRAREAAAFLEIEANVNGKTLLVSHGLLNHYLVKYLKKSGWTQVYDGGKGYLSQKLLIKQQ